tara:strand:+ start:2948 stop:3634 length:687 start_codon:yes stop_codon:yes gene_type:complete
MYIAVSNSIGSSSNSGTPLPPPPSEYYDFYNCVEEEGSSSQNYPIGTFVVGDMVTFEISGQPGYGRVQEILEGDGGAIAITATGANQEGYCNLSDIAFNPTLFVDGDNIILSLDGTNNGPNNLVDDGPNKLNYYYSFNIDYDNGSLGTATIDGYLDIANYNMAVGGFNLGDFIVYNIPNLVSIDVTYTATYTEFGSTISYTNGDGCINKYFLRTNDGTTFYCTTPNDC